MTQTTAQSLTTEQRIRLAHRTLATNPGDYIRLAELRALLADLPRVEQDAALLAMSRSQTASIIPFAAQRFLTDADRAAALRIGMTDCHLIAITG